MGNSSYQVFELSELNCTSCYEAVYYIYHKIPIITLTVYNPWGLIFRGVIHGRSFPFRKLVSKRTWAYTRWVLSQFYGILHCLIITDIRIAYKYNVLAECSTNK